MANDGDLSCEVDGEGHDKIVKELKAENDRLRRENEGLHKQLQDLSMRIAESGIEFKQAKGSSGFETKLEDGSAEWRGKLEEDEGRIGPEMVNSFGVGKTPDGDRDPVEKKGISLKEARSKRRSPERFEEAESEQGEAENLKGEGDLGNQNSGSCVFAGEEKRSCSGGFVASGHSLSADAIRRYSRQLLVPSFGVAGQERLLKSSALIVGCGGLGSPIALYLAAAGIGCLGLVDHDHVDLSNLHRQVIHTEAFVGKAKVKSAASACLKLNSSLQVVEYGHGLNATNAVEIISKFDLVLDATDNLPTRYLLSDACVVTGKPLVSGAALGVEGQVTVYNHNNGPCYRCLFPIPPPQAAHQRCSDSGVIGVVPGIIGTFQALEALKLAGQVGETLSSRMLILDALTARIHMVKLRGRKSACVACGDAPQIHLSNLHLYDYEGFTQSPLTDEAPRRQHVIPESDRISDEQLKRYLDSDRAYVLLDVRDAHEFAISSLPNSINIPFSSLQEKLQMLQVALEDSRLMRGSKSAGQPEQSKIISDRPALNGEVSNGQPGILDASLVNPAIYVVCRRGNDSQRAVQLLRAEGFSTAVDVIGGLESWARNVNKDFPFY